MQTIHPLTKAREDRNLTQIQLAEAVKLSGKTIWSAEHNKPISAHSRRCLCRYFKKSSEELGLVSEEANIRDRQQANQLPTSPVPAQPPAPVDVEPPLLQPAAIPPTHPSVSIMPAASIQAIDLLTTANDVTLEEQAGAWLAVGTAHLGQLFDANWSVEDILQGLQVVLRGVQGMSPMTRRSLLRIGAGALLAEIAIPDGKHVSGGEQIQLCQGLGESIGTAWKLFHSASTPQMLAIAQAQLFMIQQSHSELYVEVRPLFYAGAYNLIGATRYFLGQYYEAQQALDRAYIAGLEAAHPWLIGQTLSWQAYVSNGLERPAQTLPIIDKALRIIAEHQDRESIRLRARLLTLGVENEALLGHKEETQIRLAEAQTLLEYLPEPHEEFDRVSWLQSAGECALALNNYDQSLIYLQQAVDELPQQWILRRASTLFSFAQALTRLKNAKQALAVAQQALPLIVSIQSPLFKQKFGHYLQAELLATFPNNRSCQQFVVEAQNYLAFLSTGKKHGLVSS